MHAHLQEPADECKSVEYLHLGALIVWICVVLAVFWFDPNWIHLLVGIIFATPLFLFWYNPSCERDVNSMVRNGMLAIGLVVTVTLLNNLSDNYDGNHQLMSVLICSSLILVLLTATDFYFGPDWMSLTYHVRIVIQTFAVGVIALAIGLYYMHRRSSGFTKASLLNIK